MFRFSSLSPSLVCRHVLFGFSPDEVRSVPRIFVYMLNVYRFSICKVRNDFRFRDYPKIIVLFIQTSLQKIRNFHKIELKFDDFTTTAIMNFRDIAEDTRKTVEPVFFHFSVL